MRSHRGAVTVESESGQGTEFTVHLPAVIQCDGPSESMESLQTASWRGEGTVLVVDDEDLVRGFARDALESFGYGVVLAGEIRAEVPVVLCSGFVDEETTNRMAANGLAASLRKPYSLVALGRTLRSVFG